MFKNYKKSKIEQRGLGSRIAAQAYLWLLLVVLYAPILLIIIFSFTQSKVFGNWTGFTFGLYENLFTGYDAVAQVKVDPNLYRAIFFTVVIALSSALISTMLGTLAAIGIYHMRNRDRKILTFMNSIPMINPDILTGISLFLLFVFLAFCLVHHKFLKLNLQSYHLK